MGSGSVAVFATPAMLALMEQAACHSIKDVMDEGEITVGTAVNIQHMAPTPVGLMVIATAEVTECSEREVPPPSLQSPGWMRESTPRFH